MSVKSNSGSARSGDGEPLSAAANCASSISRLPYLPPSCSSLRQAIFDGGIYQKPLPNIMFTSSSSEESFLTNVTPVEDETVKLPPIQTRDRQVKERPSLTMTKSASKLPQAFPLTKKAIRDRIKLQKIDETSNRQELQNSLEKKLHSLSQIKERMMSMAASQGCHLEERKRRLDEATTRQWEQVEAIIQCAAFTHRQSILNKYRKIRNKEEECKKKEVERKMEIIHRLLNEEKMKRMIGKVNLVRSIKPKQQPEREPLVEGSVVEEESDEEEEEREEEEEYIEEDEENGEDTMPAIKGKRKTKSQKEERSPKSPKGKKVKSVDKTGSKRKEKKPKSGKKKVKQEADTSEVKEVVEVEVAAVQDEKPSTHSEQLVQDFKRWQELAETRRQFTAIQDDEDLQLPEEYRVECKPERIEFKNFILGSVYRRRFRITNVGSRTLLICLHRITVLNCDDPRIIQVEPTFHNKIGLGLNCTVEVILNPLRSTACDTITGELVFITKTDDNERRRLGITVVATPCRAEPKITPAVIRFLPAMRWSSLKQVKYLRVTNSGSKSCTMNLQQVLRDEHASLSDLTDSVNVNDNFQKHKISQFFTDNSTAQVDSNNNMSIPIDIKDNNQLKKSVFMITNQHSSTEHKSNNSENTLESKKSNVSDFIVQICKELFESVFSVFKFKSKYNIHIPANGEVAVPIEFLPQLAQYTGAICFTYAATFEADCVLNSSQEIIVCGHIDDIPVKVDPLVLDLKLCYLGGSVQQSSFCIYNENRHVYSFTVRLPTALTSHVQIDPKEGYLQANTSLTILVRLITRWSLLTDAKKYFQPEIGLLDFPVYVHIHSTDHDPPPPIVVNIMAVITSPCALSINPTSISFGYVSTMETVKTSLYLTNHSSAVYRFGFTNLPQCISIQPSGGFGYILPGETVQLRVLYSPTVADIHASCTVGCKGEHRFKIQCFTSVGLALKTYFKQGEKVQKSLGKEESAGLCTTISAGHRTPIPPPPSLTVTYLASDGLNVENDSELSTNKQQSVSGQEKSSRSSEEIKNHESYPEIMGIIDEASGSVEEKGKDPWEKLFEFEITDINSLYSHDDIDHIETTNGSFERKSQIESAELNLSSVSDRVSLHSYDVNSAEDDTFYADIVMQENYRRKQISVNICAYVIDPLVELSAQKVIFPDTALYSFNILNIYLRSRVQKGCHCGLIGENAHIFETDFEFKSGHRYLSVEPRRGTISNNQCIKVSLMFHPVVRTKKIVERAKELKAHGMEQEMLQEYYESKMKQDGKQKKGKSLKANKGKKKSRNNKKEENQSKESKDKKGVKSEKLKKGKSQESKAVRLFEEVPQFFVDPETITLNDEDLMRGKQNVLQFYRPYVTMDTLSCVLQTKLNNKVRWEVLHCNVVCPVVVPSIVLQSDSSIDFGHVAISTVKREIFPVFNISNTAVPVHTSTLNPVGQFSCPLRIITKEVCVGEKPVVNLEPEHSLNIPVVFRPLKTGLVTEYFEIISGITVIPVMISGNGVMPEYEIIPNFVVFILEAAKGKKPECSIVIKNLCDATLPFHINKVCVKEGYSLPEPKASVTEEADGPKKDKKGKKQPKKPKAKKKDVMQKQYENVPEEWVNHFENNFSLISDDDMFSLVGLDGTIADVLPGESVLLKIRYSQAEKQKGKSSKDKKRSQSETKRRKSASPNNRKRSKSEGDSPGSPKQKGKKEKGDSPSSAKQKGKKEKGDSPSSPKQKGKKEKIVKDNKKKIYLAKYAVTLAGVVPVKEWIIIVYNKK